MTIRRLSVALAVVLSALVCTSASAGATWKDEGGRFTMELPKKWKMEENTIIMGPEAIKETVLVTEPDADFSDYTDEDLTVEKFKFSNKKQKASVYIVFSPAAAEIGHEEMFQDTLDSLPESGLTDIAVTGDIKDLSVNGHPARWAIYRGLVEGTTIALYGHIGAVSLEKGTLSFFAMLSESKSKDLAADLEGMFKSLN